MTLDTEQKPETFICRLTSFVHPRATLDLSSKFRGKPQIIPLCSPEPNLNPAAMSATRSKTFFFFLLSKFSRTAVEPISIASTVTTELPDPTLCDFRWVPCLRQPRQFYSSSCISKVSETAADAKPFSFLILAICVKKEWNAS